ncbi:MAG: hypothetical protein F4X77_17345 [Acidobacteriia bacterium]|nr:hypothetical protein [Terriglobia bacterium]
MRRLRSDAGDACPLGDRSTTAWAIAGSLMLIKPSTARLIDLAGDAFNYTIAVTALETPAAIAMVATALFLPPRHLRMNLSTIPENIAARYDQTPGVINAAVFVFS